MTKEQTALRLRYASQLVKNEVPDNKKQNTVPLQSFGGSTADVLVQSQCGMTATIQRKYTLSFESSDILRLQ